MNIDPKELRIGNWILDHIGVPRQVAYVGETVGVKNGIGGTQKYQHNPIISGDINDLRPFPLSPFLMEMIGWEKEEYPKSNSVRYYTEKGYVALYERGRYAGMVYKVYINGHSAKVSLCKHLHQLQNLYFALVGEELEVSIKAQ